MEGASGLVKMVGTYYLMVVNALTIVLYAQDKIVSKGWLPFLGRVPGV